MTASSNIFFRQTNNDGRASAFLEWDDFISGVYKAHFDVKSYFEKRGQETFFPFCEVRKLKLNHVIVVTKWLS